MNPESYELIIIGGGPAGTSAGVYAARKQIKTALIAESFGGQSIESNEIQNWIGTIAISGMDLAKSFKKHVKFYAGDFVDIKEGERVSKVEHIENDGFLVTTNKDIYKTKMVLVATGSSRKKLEVDGAKEFEGKGITYCASCDGPFFKNKDVVVIGGGNAGFESAMQLLAYCKSVTLLSRGQFRADPVTVEKALENPKLKAIPHAIPIKIKGKDFVESIMYKTTSPFVVDEEIKTDGIFVEIGHTPATSFVNDLVDTDEFGRIIIDHKTQQTSKKGIWASGDCTDVLYHQNNIASGDAVKAIEDIYIHLRTS
jgi:NADH-dependent peroxiredoxin subunit F